MKSRGNEVTVEKSLTLQQSPGKTLYVFPHSHSYNNYRYNYLYFNHLKSPFGGFPVLRSNTTPVLRSNTTKDEKDESDYLSE